MMSTLKIKKTKHLLLWVFAFSSFCSRSQLAGCDLMIPPFISSGVEVTHDLDINIGIYYDPSPPWLLCLDSIAIVSNANALILLGDPSPLFNPWNPFIYYLYFSKPILSMDFVLYVSGTGIMGIDMGAENFVFETFSVSRTIQSIYACNDSIIGDTLLLGINNLNGDGLFSISFDCPIYKLAISGKGGGGGTRFQICQNSLTTPNLWGRVSGDSLLTTPQDSIFFTAFGGVAPFEFTYTVNGGAAQTVVSNTPQAWLPAPASNGTYTYELLQVKDGNDSVAVIACNSEYVAVVNLASTKELETIHFTLSPNPANDKVYLSESVYFAENTAVQLTDMEGRIVLETHYQIGEAIDVSTLNRGLYFLRIATDRGWVAKRFVKL